MELAVAQGADLNATREQSEASARTILIVDDNVSSAQTLAMLLELAGHVAHVAHAGDAGIETFERHRPEVVLLDIGLPGLDGYEVARRIRRSEGGREAVLIAATGYGRDEDRRKAVEAGFDHHLVKPIDLEALQRLLADPVRLRTDP